MHQPGLITVNIFRRNYGRRYTGLPVDILDQTSLVIHCDHRLMRPDLYDLCPGDLVRWRQDEQYVEAVISSVHREQGTIYAALSNFHQLPPDFFPY